MSDPLQDPLVSPHIEQLKFSKLHSPKMKSVYWRHFAFPANEDNCIITKQNVVCTLCNKVLTNHGNTTNLRAHLQYRHKDIFNQIIEANGIQVPPRRTPNKSMLNGGGVKVKREPGSVKKKPKIEYQPELSSDYSSNVIVNDSEEHAILYETVVPMTYEDDGVVDTNHFTKVEVKTTDVKPSTSKLMQMNNRLSTERNRNRISDINTNNLTVTTSYQLHEALANLVIDEVRNVESLYGPSMSKFVRSLCGNVTMPSIKKIELYIKELHQDKMASLAEEIKIHSQIKPYSLGFELWNNIEQKKFLSIFFNYTTETPKYNLVNQMFCTVEYNKYTAFDALFDEFNLQNCTAAIINYKDEDYLKEFLNGKNVPWILSYDAIIDECIRKVTALPAVTAIIEEIKDLLSRYSSDYSSKDVEIPIVCDDYPWTYFELLKFFSDTLFWPDEIEALVSSAKGLYEILKTLAVTLDTLKAEDIPLSSMLSPITAKVLTRKLAINENDDSFIAIIKNTVTDELNRLVLSDDQLTISALLDPRFHRLINTSNMNNCVKILAEKYDRIIESQGISPSVSSQNRSKTSSENVTKKSNLELFFDLTDNQVYQPSTSIPNSVEADLKRFHNEVYCNLDESPFLWWNRMGHLFGSLNHLAYQYQCVPCVVNMNYRNTIKEQILENQKRYMLTGHLIDAILYLHYN